MLIGCFKCFDDFLIINLNYDEQVMDHLCCTCYYFRVDFHKLFDISSSLILMDFAKHTKLPDN